jgi:UDP-N-acetylglucosamine--N-acetylmuramyl-(pentapeptide) pyrophosphoryl-undecaprenol N-acetylglucosamine transferase
VVYIGSEDGMEAGLVRRESDLPFLGVPAAAIRGRGPLAMARNAGTLARGVLVARRLIAGSRPAAILGTGGYVCVPVFLAARALGVPTAIFLPDVVPGLAVRLLSRLATVTACSVPDSAKYLRLTIDDGRLGGNAGGDNNRQSAIAKRKLVVTGYPVRPEFHHLDHAACRAAFGLQEGLPTILITGGSRGARSINTAVAAVLPQLLELAQLIHVCGREGDETFLQAAAAQLPEALRRRYYLYPYLHSETGERASGQAMGQGEAADRSMVAAFGASDLVICRSGASTLGELPAAGLPAVLVPYPFVHQDENADFLVRHGAAHKLNDGELLSGGGPEQAPLLQTVRRLIGDANERNRMAQRSRELAQPQAARRLADLLLQLAARGTPA